LLIIITSRAAKVRRICAGEDGEDDIARQSHAKCTKSTVFTVVGLDIGAISGTFSVGFLK
jgi:hypothetical protein